ncbi:hypothetical protein [Streptosporangium fragile]|uniref:hypothetical protein n=1 Tax=Streptosporangium fragile TaxID=46186 RepID=UPI0031EA691C
MDLPGNRAIGTLAVTKKRGGPVAGRGAEVAMGSARDVAKGGGSGTAAGLDGCATAVGMVGDGDDGNTVTAAVGTGPRSAARASPQAPVSASTSSPAVTAPARENMR